MKKIKILALSIILITVLVCLTGCGFNKDDEKEKDENSKGKTEETVNFIDNNKSYFIMIDGDKFYAGDKIEKLSNVGYNVKSSEASQDIPANKYMIGAGSMMNSEDKRIFSVTPFNTNNSPTKVSDAVIGGIDISYSSAKNDDKSANFEVYGGIKLGSTEEEVKKVFGEPTSVYEGSNYKSYKYESDEVYRSYDFRFNADGKVSDIEWKNLVFNK